MDRNISPSAPGTSCRLQTPDRDKDTIRRILTSCRTLAVVGLSPKPSRDSHRVASYLLKHGYTVVPVNPGQKEILGSPCYKSLLEIPFPVDLADLFLSPDRIPAVVAQAIAKKIPVLWMQQGVVHEEAAQQARDAGIEVIMDRCIMQDHMRAFPP